MRKKKKRALEILGREAMRRRPEECTTTELIEWLDGFIFLQDANISIWDSNMLKAIKSNLEGE